jgi:hypothetical protein
MLQRLNHPPPHFLTLNTNTMSSGLKLYTMTTPNGWKPSIYLEELKAAYGTTYEFAPTFPRPAPPD